MEKISGAAIVLDLASVTDKVNSFASGLGHYAGVKDSRIQAMR